MLQARLPPLELRGRVVSRPVAVPPEWSGHRVLGCRGSGYFYFYFYFVFGSGPNKSAELPVTWV